MCQDYSYINEKSNKLKLQGRIQKLQKGGAEETDDVVLYHSGSICDQTLRLNVKNFLKLQEEIRS